MLNIVRTLPLYNWTYPEECETGDFPSSVPPLFGRLISDRGLADAGNEEALRSFLDARLSSLVNPGEFPGIREAVSLISETIRGNGKILIFGDFDCDGISATAIMLKVLRFLQADVSHFIPLRSEGYGFTDDSVKRCLSGGVPSLLITVDCGITAGPHLQRFLDLGCKVIVSDHHTKGDPLPPKCVVVSTYSESVPEACRYLCGAGIAYKIACGLISTIYPLPDRTGRPLLNSLLDILAVATVADVVPLIGENRIYVRNGLALLRHRCNTGLAALLKKTLKVNPEEFTPYHASFIIGPNINASGRMASAEIALELLTTDDKDAAWECAVKLERLNSERRATEAEMVKSAEEQLKSESVFDEERDGAVVVAQKGWHPGVAGIAAARISECYMRPAVVISIDENGEGHGSVRAPEGYNASAALRACASLLLRFGGHANAAGLAIREEQIDAFRKEFAKVCTEQVGGVSVRNNLEIAGTLGFGDVSLEFTDWLKQLEPCGQGNPSPVWQISDAVVKTSVIGKNNDHLRVAITTDDGIELQAVWFGGGKFQPQIALHYRWDVAGRLEEDDFNPSNPVIKMIITDMRPSAGE